MHSHFTTPSAIIHGTKNSQNIPNTKIYTSKTFGRKENFAHLNPTAMDGIKFKNLKTLATLLLSILVLTVNFSEATPQLSKIPSSQSDIRHNRVTQLLFGGRPASSHNYEMVGKNFGATGDFYQFPSSSQEYTEHETIIYDQPEGSHTTIYGQYEEPTNEIDGGDYYEYSPYQISPQFSANKPVREPTMSLSSVVRHGRNVVNMMGSYLRTYLPITRRLAPQYEGYNGYQSTPNFQFVE